MLLTGEYYPTIDANGRLAFPSKLREYLGEHFYITWTKNSYLVVYSEEELNGIAEKIKMMPVNETMDTRRMIFTNAINVEPDKQGRVVIPLGLRELAEIKDEVAIVGNMDRAEIWPKEVWLKEKAKQNAPGKDSTFEELRI